MGTCRQSYREPVYLPRVIKKVSLLPVQSPDALKGQKLKIFEFGARKGLSGKESREKMGDLVVPQIHLTEFRRLLCQGKGKLEELLL